MILAIDTLRLHRWPALAALVAERGGRRAWDLDMTYVPWGWRA